MNCFKCNCDIPDDTHVKINNLHFCDSDCAYEYERNITVGVNKQKSMEGELRNAKKEIIELQKICQRQSVKIAELNYTIFEQEQLLIKLNPKSW